MSRLPSDKELEALAAAAMIMHATTLPLSSASGRIVWRANMRPFLFKLGVDGPTADLIQEILYWHRYKGMTLPESLTAARRELSKPQPEPKRGKRRKLWTA